MRWTDGNMTQDGVYTYTYDAENRLICVAPTTPATGSEKVESVYDYMGRRVQKTVTAWDGSIGTGGDWATTPESITRFVYDGWNVVLELNGLVFDNVATAWDERVSRKYTWGLDLSGLSGNPTVSGIHGAGGIGGLLATAVQVGSSSIGHVYFYDGNGNVGQTLNIGNDTLTARYEYDPYGNLVSILGGPFRNRNPFRFSTKYFDRELDLHGTNDGLYYYGYRFYSARLGRWVTRDPVGEEGAVLVRNLGIPGLAFTHPVADEYSKDGLWMSVPFAKWSRVKDTRRLNPFCFLQNDVVSAVDPHGLDRYRGSDGMGGLHVWIAVDEWACDGGCWKKVGIRRFDFSVDWNAWGGWGWLLGAAIFKGHVIDQTFSQIDGVSKTESSSACQDIVLLRFLEMTKRITPAYSALMYNCQDYVSEHWSVGMHRETPSCCDDKSCPELASDSDSKTEVLPEAF